MKAIIPVFDYNSGKPLYLQLYEHIRNEIIQNEIVPGEKLPSLRNLSSSLGLSITTTTAAYNQLAVEGYVENRNRSGYYVREVGVAEIRRPREITGEKSAAAPSALPRALASGEEAKAHLLYDLSCFDFVKWKKCLCYIINEMPDELFFSADPRGEYDLRVQIASYIYRSRGVSCNPEQIVIAAGTQQITSLLAAILTSVGLHHIALEDPGYLPVHQIFTEQSFLISRIPVEPDGIDPDDLPSNIRSAVYVNPSNQFPTGAVMSAGKRYALLEWAERNNSYIIEDDYDSELRYFGKPIPSLRSLDAGDRVIYLGSFSSTLFAAAKISYMVLPEPFSQVYSRMKDNRSQTCSKTEQLALAHFMKQGYYATGIKKMRRLYAQKLDAVVAAFRKANHTTVENARSGLSILLMADLVKPASVLCREAASLGVEVSSVSNPVGDSRHALILYYHRIPLDAIPSTIAALIKKWES